MKPVSALVVCLTLWSGAAFPAFAQSTGADPEAKPETQTGPAEVVAPYDDKLLRLAEVLGAIHYLRNLCKSGETDQWRKVMEEILVSEQPSEKRKATLISRFNRGYNAFNEIYGHCTASAVTAAERYVKEGVLLSSQITSRYGR